MKKKKSKKLKNNSKYNSDINKNNYYGCVLKLPNTDDRLKRYRKQRDKRGFDDTEMWSLDSTIMEFILPRLKRLRKIEAGYPMGLTKKKWNKKLDSIVYWLENSNEVLDYNDGKMLEGKKNFSKHFHNLWY